MTEPSPYPTNGTPGQPPDRTRILRIIGRMNLGGPAYHVSLLSSHLDREAYETLLVTGQVGPGEETFVPNGNHQLRVETLATLGPRIRPVADARALVSLIRIARRFRPDIVHTHTSKAGMLGRTAAFLALRPRPVIVHTYHGHVLEGYFGPLKTRVYRAIERLLARVSDRLICVSDATANDLVRLGVAPPERFRVIAVGLDLDDFLVTSQEQALAFRGELGAGPDDVVVTYVGRLVPVKRVDVLLRATARARELGAPIRLAIVGDGELRSSLERLAQDLGLNGVARFLGYRTDVASITAGSDIAALTSDQEGTPVSLIQAAAAARPLVSTRVGGVPDVVPVDAGFLVPPRDERTFADALVTLAADHDLRNRMGARAREHVLGRYSSARLLDETASLYHALLDGRERATLAPSRGATPNQSAGVSR